MVHKNELQFAIRSENGNLVEVLCTYLRTAIPTTTNCVIIHSDASPHHCPKHIQLFSYFLETFRWSWAESELVREENLDPLD